MIQQLHYAHDMSTRQIGDLFGLSSASVSYWIRCGRRPRGHPPQHASNVKRRALVKQMVTQVRTLRDSNSRVWRRVPLYGSASCIARALVREHGISVSKMTALRDLRALGFSCRVRRKVTSTAQRDATERQMFAKRMLRKGKQFLNRIVFSDEKIFTSNDQTWRKMWVASPKNLLPRESKRFPAGRVLVWGAIGVNFRRLVIFPEKEVDDETQRKKTYSLTAARYVHRCLAPISKQLDKEERVFQQDGAGAHKTDYLDKKGVTCVTDWPPRSPQLSPIETLWGILVPRVSSHHPKDRKELITAVRTEWDSMSANTINSLVTSFHSRCKACADGRL